jgi:hypothetical protein
MIRSEWVSVDPCTVGEQEKSDHNLRWWSSLLEPTSAYGALATT